jgi:hypothetical protein
LNSILEFFLHLLLFTFQSKWKIEFKTRKAAKLRLKGWKKSVEILKRKSFLAADENRVGSGRKMEEFLS